MKIPNLKAIKTAEILKERHSTILCTCCKKPLWRVTLLGQYGTRFKTKTEAFPGVPEYSDYFDASGKKNFRDDCPFCGNVWFQMIMQSDGQRIAKPLTLEWG